MKRIFYPLLLPTVLAACFVRVAAAQEPDSLPPIREGRVPQNLDELWAGYDPRREPIETQVQREWEDQGVVCRVVRYRVGTFRGKPAWMAAFYAFPKGAVRAPAILQIHGGGQSANLAMVVTNARLGYASASLNWGGNKMTLAGGAIYDGPNTDWGALDATHPPQRNKNNHFAGGTEPDEFTLDPVASPRNDNWFVVTVGTRRALTFLEQQPEVDPGRIGVTGHSMGGRLTTMLAAIDSRVRAAVPSCGGSGDFTGDPDRVPGCERTRRSALDLETVSENPYIRRLKVPTLWFSPTNDFHAHMNHFAFTWRDVPDELLGLSMAPHFNHRHTDAHGLTAVLWFEKHLKNAAQLPRTPGLRFGPRAAGGDAVLLVEPDPAHPVEAVRVYASADRHALTRFWRSVPVERRDGVWKAVAPVLEAGEPLFAYADVEYAAPEAYRNIPRPPGVGASSAFMVSSRMVTVTGRELEAGGVRPSARQERLLDSGESGWQDWFRLNWANPVVWSATTRKVKDPLWRGPKGARLALEVVPGNDCTLFVKLTRNDWGAFGPGKGEYFAEVPLKAAGGWVAVELDLKDFQPLDDQQKDRLTDWSTLTDLTLSGFVQPVRGGRKEEKTTVAWKQPLRIRNLRWEGGVYEAAGGAGSGLSEVERTKAFNEAIKASLEQEKRDGQR